MTSSRFRLASLADARRAVLDLAPDARAEGPFDAAQALAHCAQSIELSRTGYPSMKPGWFRATVGRIALGRFLARGYLTHDRGAAIPGAPTLEPGAPFEVARARLVAAIDAFEAHDGPLAPHFAYGPVEKPDYDRVHAMHVADHLGVFA